MAKRVFFSFHYQRDVWRAMQVRNSWVTQERQQAGFFDGGIWEKAKTTGEDAVKRLIRNGLENTSVTAVLIGAQTDQRRWVDFEIRESWDRGNGLIGIRINKLKNRDGYIDAKGANPFDNVWLTSGECLGGLIPVYDWVEAAGYLNLGTWVNDAPKRRLG